MKFQRGLGQKKNKTQLLHRCIKQNSSAHLAGTHKRQGLMDDEMWNWTVEL